MTLVRTTALACIVFAQGITHAADKPGKAVGSENLLLRSRVMIPALEFPGDARQIRALTIRGHLPEKGNANAKLIFDLGDYTFNDFGDARQVNPRSGTPIRLRLRPEKYNTGFKLGPAWNSLHAPRYRIFAVEAVNGVLPARMTLVIADEYAGPHRLVIRNAANKVIRIVELAGKPAIQPVLQDRRLPKSFHLGGVFPEAKPITITITGQLATKGSLTLDRNRLDFDNAGNVTLSTLVGFLPTPIRFRRMNSPDPLKKRRELYELIIDSAWKRHRAFAPPSPGKPAPRYMLVVSPTEGGEHRLLIHRGDTLKQCFSLHNPSRRYFLLTSAGLATVPANERAAIRQLTKSIGHHLSCTVRDGHITALATSERVDDRAVNQAIKSLANLRELSLTGLRVTATGLSNLAALKDLRSLRFTFCTIDDRGLAAMRSLAKLEHLVFVQCEGVTDHTLSYVSRLSKLKTLHVQPTGITSRMVSQITGQGLKHLKTLKSLETLSLADSDLNDEGLRNLSSLQNLKSLTISGKNVTDTGLRHLAVLKKLQQLSLTKTSTTAAGVESLRSRIPALRRP